MAILGKTPAKEDGIPPMLQRTNGKAQPSYEELLAQVEALKAQVSKGSTIRMKVSEKGALSVYGLGRFPVSLYKSQWQALLGHTAQIAAFIAEHHSELSTKD
jgi:hypothetical protein